MTAEYIYEYTKQQPKYPVSFKIGGELDDNEFNKYITGIAGGLITYGGGVEVNIDELSNIDISDDETNTTIVIGESDSFTGGWQISNQIEQSASTVSSDLRKLFEGLHRQKLKEIPKKKKPRKKNTKKKGGNESESSDESDDEKYLSDDITNDIEMANEINKLDSDGEPSQHPKSHRKHSPDDSIEILSGHFDINDFIE
jgi:hypothetical protein